MVNIPIGDVSLPGQSRYELGYASSKLLLCSFSFSFFFSVSLKQESTNEKIENHSSVSKLEYFKIDISFEDTRSNLNPSKFQLQSSYSLKFEQYTSVCLETLMCLK